jgi:hypothetical protein
MVISGSNLGWQETRSNEISVYSAGYFII